MEEKQWKQWLTLFFWAPKSLQMVIAAMKLKDAYSLEGKLWPTSVQFSSFQSLSRVRLYDSMNCSMSGLSVHHQLPEFTLTHVHQVGDAIQPSHPLLSPSLLPSIFPSIRVFSNESVLCIRWPKYWSFISASVPPMNLQDWFPLGWASWIFLLSKGLSRVFSNTTVQKHQFFCAQLSLQSTSHINTWVLEKP